jgi:SAM-dependent methyltransferase
VPQPRSLPTPVPADLPARWPVAVRTEVDRRRRRLLEDAASGAALFDVAGGGLERAGLLPATRQGPPRVLDLASPEGRGLFTAAVGAAGGAGAGSADTGPAGTGVDGSFDAIISAAGLARFADLAAAVATVDRLLVPGGVLLAIEPAPLPGMGGLVAASLGSLIPAARGAHLARDLQVTLRTAGFTITDAERFTMPTLVWPLRPFLQVRALRAADIVAAASGSAT